MRMRMVLLRCSRIREALRVVHGVRAVVKVPPMYPVALSRAAGCGPHGSSTGEQVVPTWLVTGGAGFICGNLCFEAGAPGVKGIKPRALTYGANPTTLAHIDRNPHPTFV